MNNLCPNPDLDRVSADMAAVNHRAHVYLDAVESSLGVNVAFDRFIVAVANVGGAGEQDQRRMFRDEMIYAKLTRGDELGEYSEVSPSIWQMLVSRARVNEAKTRQPLGSGFGALMDLGFVGLSGAEAVEARLRAMPTQET